MSVIKSLAGILETVKEEHTNESQRQWTLHVWSPLLSYIEDEILPSGSGFDSGSKVDYDRSFYKGEEVIRIETAFHHMDDGGGYCGWTKHTVTVRPRLDGNITVSVSGQNYRGIKEYIREVFADVLESDDKDTKITVKQLELIEEMKHGK